MSISKLRFVIHRLQWRHLHTLLALVMFTTAAPVLAEHKDEPKPDLLEQTRSAVAGSLNYITRKVDAFFGDDREFEDTIGSWARINLQARLQEKLPTEYNSTIQARIALPRTESRFHIIVESDTDKNLDGEVFSGDPLTSITEPTYSGGMRYIIKYSDKWYAHADAGIEFSTPIDAFVRGRLRRNFRWGSWRFQAAETLTQYQSARANAVTQVDLEHLLSKNLLFRNRFTVGIRKLPEESDWSFDTSLVQRLDSKQALQYQYVVRGDYYTPHATGYEINLRYRRRLHRKWMFIEITPQALYREVDNFVYTPSIYFKLEMLFRKD